MKVFISSDMEGTCGIAHWDETDYARGGRWYEYFREQMSRESAACAEGAFAGGAEGVMVKDAHDSARNVLPTCYPEKTMFARGWPGSPNSMVDGIEGGYGAAAFTGYHAGALSGGSPLSHTMATKIHRVRINGMDASEFHIHALAAAFYGAKALFISGDGAICEAAESYCPGIACVAVNWGRGDGSFSMHPKAAQDLIREGMKGAMEKADCVSVLEIPSSFAVTVEYVRHPLAYSSSFFPGARLTQPNEVAFESEGLKEALAFLRFAL
jgi:D-amino peptidase